MKPNRITHYLTLIAEDSDDLDKQANQFLKGGWQPHGGVALSEYRANDSTITVLAQAMVKFEEAKG